MYDDIYEFVKANKEAIRNGLLDYLCESPEEIKEMDTKALTKEFIGYIRTTITSNIQYDFNLEFDVDMVLKESD